MDWLVVENNISQTQLQKEIEILFIIEHYFFFMIFEKWFTDIIIHSAKWT